MANNELSKFEQRASVVVLVLALIVFVLIAVYAPQHSAAINKDRIENGTGVVLGDGYAIFPADHMSSEEVRSMVDNYLARNDLKLLTIENKYKHRKRGVTYLDEVLVTYEPRKGE